MLKNFFNKFGNKSQPDSNNSHIIPRDKHSISRENISPAAIKVMNILLEQQFDAYLVGGGVRDLLLGGHPKDFDIATNATPEQVVKLFNRARIIGRRFRIVHVRMMGETIEVTTFRGGHEAPTQARGKAKNQTSAQSASGMLLRDNVFGSIEEDAIRRDFTINALYYTTKDFSVHDYANGIADLNNKTIRIIGDPETRYREDPVRMLRAVRFAAKLGFDIESDTATPINTLGDLLQDVSGARLFDESLKLFLSGYSAPLFPLLQEYQLFEKLFPYSAEALDKQASYEKMIHLACKNGDKRIQQEKSVTPAFIYAVLLWPAAQQRQYQLMADGLSEYEAIHQAGQEIASYQQRYTAIPKRFSFPMREIWELQLRFNNRHPSKVESLLSHRRFRAAYDFLVLREQSGEATDELGAWWTQYQIDQADYCQSLIQAAKPKAHYEKRRPPRKRKPRSNHGNNKNGNK